MWTDNRFSFCHKPLKHHICLLAWLFPGRESTDRVGVSVSTNEEVCESKSVVTQPIDQPIIAQLFAPEADEGARAYVTALDHIGRHYPENH